MIGSGAKIFRRYHRHDISGGSTDTVCLLRKATGDEDVNWKLNMLRLRFSRRCFLVVTKSSDMKGYRRFGGSFCFQLQGEGPGILTHLYTLPQPRRLRLKLNLLPIDGEIELHNVLKVVLIKKWDPKTIQTFRLILNICRTVLQAKWITKSNKHSHWEADSHGVRHEVPRVPRKSKI
jgi:hypothetical protein